MLGKFLLFTLILLAVQKAYSTCVSNYSDPKQDINYTISAEGCPFNTLQSHSIPYGKTHCMDPHFPDNQDCQPQLSIMGTSYPLDKESCNLTGTPEEIGTYTFQVEGSGCYVNEKKSELERKAKGNKTY